MDTVRTAHPAHASEAHFWRRVFVDALDALATGDLGLLHSSLDISLEGAVLVVRPDGYVGTITSLGIDSAKELGNYFSAFMT